MKKKILGVLLAAGIIAGVITGCGNSNTTQNGAENASQASATAKARTLDEIKKSGKIKIGVFSDKNPFGYVDENGKVQGYDVYFAKRIAKDLLGSEDAVDFVYVEAASRVEYLKSAKVDITLANFTVTDERKEQVDFALPYMKVALGIVSPQKAEITDVNQLKGKKLIVVKGTTAETYFSKNYPDVTLVKFDEYQEAYDAFVDGRQYDSGGRCVRSVPIYPAESGFVLRRGNSGAAHHDEPEPAGGKGPPPCRKRLQGESQNGNYD